MSVTRIERQARAYQLQQAQLVAHRVADHRLQLERNEATRVNETRVARNIRLDHDKGRHIDVDV
jgi:hypothetical protein